MTCHSTGRYPIGTMGFGTLSAYSRNRIPSPPQNITTFMCVTPSPRKNWRDFQPNANLPNGRCGYDPLFPASIRKQVGPASPEYLFRTTGPAWASSLCDDCQVQCIPLAWTPDNGASSPNRRTER